VNLQKSARRIVLVETHVHVLRVANPHTCASMTLSATLHGLDRPGARVLFTHSNVMECLVVRNVQTETTFNNGSLGSRIDEERSEMR
jgi:hypothetical protein